jgi:hypothetical protein
MLCGSRWTGTLMARSFYRAPPSARRVAQRSVISVDPASKCAELGGPKGR